MSMRKKIAAGLMLLVIVGWSIALALGVFYVSRNASAATTDEPPATEVKYYCSPLSDKTRVCVIGEATLEAIIDANNEAQRRVRELKDKRCADATTARL